MLSKTRSTRQFLVAAAALCSTIASHDSIAGDSACREPDFPLPASYIGYNSTGLAMADVDGDGDIDAAMNAAASREVWIALNDGDGGFAIVQEFEESIQFAAPILADFDGDLDPDLAFVSCCFNDKLWIKRNQDGTFVSAGSYNVSSEPNRIDAAKINEDQAADIVLIRTGALQVFWGSGQATFTPGGGYLHAGLGTALALSDHDGDDNNEIAVGVGSEVHLLDYVGTTLASVTPLAVTGTVEEITALDADTDRDLDLIVFTSGPNQALLLQNDGVGNFTLVATYPLEDAAKVAAPITHVEGGDLDVVYGTAQGRLGLLANQGAGAFAVQDVGQVALTIRDLAVADLENDGDQDVAVMDPGSGSEIGALVNVANLEGELVTCGFYSAFKPGDVEPVVSSVILRDFSGDDFVDAVTTYHIGGLKSSGFTIQFGDAEGSFATAVDYPTGLGALMAIAGADMNGDRDQDLIVSLKPPFFGGGIPHQIVVMDNDGNGLFTPRWSIQSPTTSPGVVQSKSVGDIDGDGDIDAVAELADELRLLTNDGKGSLTMSTLAVLPANVCSVNLDYFNDDEHLDLIVGVCSGIFAGGTQLIMVMLNDGRGDFSDGFQVVSPPGPGQTLLGDVNGDSLTDLLAVKIADGDIYLFLNDGLEGLDAPVLVPATESGVTGLALDDIDEDGDLDLLAGAHSLEVALNSGSGTWALAGKFNTPDSATSDPVAKDIDGDGDRDVVITSRGGLVVFPNQACDRTLNPADLDEDRDVDGVDLALLLGQWGRCPAKRECAADLDGNGVVNGFDLAILLAAWG